MRPLVMCRNTLKCLLYSYITECTCSTDFFESSLKLIVQLLEVIHFDFFTFWEHPSIRISEHSNLLTTKGSTTSGYTLGYLCKTKNCIQINITHQCNLKSAPHAGVLVPTTDKWCSDESIKQGKIWLQLTLCSCIKT